MVLFIDYFVYIALPILCKDDISTIKYYNYHSYRRQWPVTRNHCVKKNRIIEWTKKIEKINETNFTEIKPQVQRSAPKKITEFIYNMFPYIFIILLFI